MTVFAGGVAALDSNAEVCAPAHETIGLYLEALQKNERPMPQSEGHRTRIAEVLDLKTGRSTRPSMRQSTA